MGWLALSAALVASGCLERASVVCADGRVCARGTVCVDALDACADPDQLAACTGRSDGTPCRTDDIPDGVCRASVCLPSQCGDGVVSATEECDPAAPPTLPCAGPDFDRGFAGCTASCTATRTAATCGFIGWRSRVTQADPPAIGLAGTAPGRGFYVTAGGVGRYDDYVAGPPTSSTNPLAAVWAYDDDTAFAVGDQVILRWTGGAWMPQDGAGNLHAVWGRGPSDVYAVGDGVVLHWDGASWTSTPIAATLRAVAGDPTHVYAVGDGGAVFVLDAGVWQPQGSGTTNRLHGVWSADGLVVAVGDGGTIIENDGTGWHAGRSNLAVDLHSVWGDARDSFFAAGDRGTLAFFDGHVWRALSLGRGVPDGETQDFTQVTGVAGEVGAVGTHDIVTYEGAAWAPVAQGTVTIEAVWGRATDEVFAVGRHGTVLRHDGLTWTPEHVADADLHDVSGTADKVYVVGEQGTALELDTGWTPIPAGGESLRAVTVVGDDVYTADDHGIYDRGGARVSNIGARALWSPDATHAWAAGDRIQRYADGVWTTESVSLSGPATDISGTADDVYTVGAASLHYAGSWRSGPFTADLAAVHASPLGAFAVGATRIEHANGVTTESLLGGNRLRAVFAIGHVVFLAGDDGELRTLVFHR